VCPCHQRGAFNCSFRNALIVLWCGLAQLAVLPTELWFSSVGGLGVV